ncbi:MAG: ribonuclease J [Clostridiales bacterium]|nr:ribonuclease J [Clostridiales bacterium]MBQ2816804.1 ribonuclease J [Clostridia bacterium]
MTVIEYEDDIIVIDCGLSFPQEDMLGVDLVIPDVSYLVKNRDKVRGFVFTHGHEDHIGSTPYVLKQLAMNVPLYGTPMTLGLINLKLKEHGMTDVPLIDIQPGDTINIGPFDIEFINVNHSISGAVAIAVNTPVGMIIHTGDFKVDFTPVTGEPIDLQRFAELGKKGVLGLLMDSTNAERPGYTMSERKVGDTFNNYFSKAKGRIIVAMFASNVQRIQQVVDAAARYNRYVVFNGRSMVNVANLAADLGELIIPEGRLLDVDDIDYYDEDQIVIITTGSQGEELAGLTRMAFSEHRKLDIRQSDMVIVSATPVPGNEKYVSRVINQLFKKGADVIYEALDDVHVSGHACQEELKIIHTLVKPEYFIPVHGEFKHLRSHEVLARNLGMDNRHIIRAKTGDVILFTKNTARIEGTVPTGAIMVDGSGVGDVGNIVLKDRKLLSQDGILIVVAVVDIQNGVLAARPEIISRGFVYVKEAEDLFDEAEMIATNTITNCLEAGRYEFNSMRNKVKDDIRAFMYSKTKRSPVILPVIMNVSGESNQ